MELEQGTGDKRKRGRRSGWRNKKAFLFLMEENIFGFTNPEKEGIGGSGENGLAGFDDLAERNGS